MGLSITPSLKNALIDLYFRETCDQEGWAYISPKDVSIKENVFVFSKGQRKIRVKVHEQIAQEIRKSAAVFDYLGCRVGQKEHGKNIEEVFANPLALCWIKTRNGRSFTEQQLEQMDKIRLPLAVFRVKDILVPPTKIEIKWETKSGKEWLDDIDDKREEAEYDDDYL
jgi:hypothetical protein